MSQFRSPDLRDRIALVTGGASGIGAAVSEALAARGAEVVVADINDSRAIAGAATVGGRALTMDVTSRASVVAGVASFARAPDILVTSAGGSLRADVLELAEDDFLQVLQLNLGGLWRVLQEVSRRVVDEGTGLAAVHIASSLYRGPAPGLAHFAAAKAASLTLVRCWAQELAGQGVRVNAVVPGPIDTPMTRPYWDAHPGAESALLERLPLGRIGRPQDVANAVLHLVDPDNDWTTGSVLTVDGGLDVAS